MLHCRVSHHLRLQLPVEQRRVCGELWTVRVRAEERQHHRTPLWIDATQSCRCLGFGSLLYFVARPDRAPGIFSKALPWTNGKVYPCSYPWGVCVCTCVRVRVCMLKMFKVRLSES